jgi:replicative DNA helicase
LHFQKIPPINVLIVDLENPEDSIVDTCNPIREIVRGKVAAEYDANRAWLWWKPGGIDIRTRTDRSKLEAVIAHTKPDLVCLGPLYKAYSVNARENDELAAGEVMRVLDDLRTRYNFALMMEHHAPKGSGSTRAMMPYGSSLWLRWPEIGLSMTDARGDGTVMDLGRWRGDRLENSWPEQLIRGSEARSSWPWTARWPDGTFAARNEAARGDGAGNGGGYDGPPHDEYEDEVPF